MGSTFLVALFVGLDSACPVRFWSDQCHVHRQLVTFINFSKLPNNLLMSISFVPLVCTRAFTVSPIPTDGHTQNAWTDAFWLCPTRALSEILSAGHQVLSRWCVVCPITGRTLGLTFNDYSSKFQRDPDRKGAHIDPHLQRASVYAPLAMCRVIVAYSGNEFCDHVFKRWGSFTSSLQLSVSAVALRLLKGVTTEPTVNREVTHQFLKTVKILSERRFHGYSRGYCSLPDIQAKDLRTFF